MRIYCSLFYVFDHHINVYEIVDVSGVQSFEHHAWFHTHFPHYGITEKGLKNGFFIQLGLLQDYCQSLHIDLLFIYTMVAKFTYICK